MIHKFKVQRQLIEEVELEVEYPDGTDLGEIFHGSRQVAKDAAGWKVILVDRPEYVESSVDFTELLK